MDNNNSINPYDHFLYWGAQILLTIVAKIVDIPWLEVVTFIGGIASLGFIIYKWRAQIKKDKIWMAIKEEELKQLRSRA